MARLPKVAIIGGGIGGLTAANALKAMSYEVVVYERASQLGEVGAGLQIGPNAVKVLRALGLEESLLAIACEPTNIVSLKWDDASLRFREPLRAIAQQNYGARYLTAHRADLHDLLRERLPAASINLDATCVDCTSDGNTAVATFADGKQIECDILVGADGIHSVIREKLFGVSPARFTHQICWRAMIPMDLVPTRVGPNGSVVLDHGEYSGWIGPNGHVICYPIRSGEVFNIFAGRVSEEWVDESWTAPSTNAELIAAYAGWNDTLLNLFMHAGDCFKWGIRDRDPLPAWVRGRIALLGDAAHPMMPTLAQGAAISIEDGYALARNLFEHSGNIEAGLAAYQSERAPRASAVQIQAREQFQDNRKIPPPPPRDRDWIFKHDVTLSPQQRSA
jgi:2-polyprenyl-6-methoxyphenol hydroxylase-like FAD-dependent oxidoreductase